jgi:hypothetical protein
LCGRRDVESGLREVTVGGGGEGVAEERRIQQGGLQEWLEVGRGGNDTTLHDIQKDSSSIDVNEVDGIRRIVCIQLLLHVPDSQESHVIKHDGTIGIMTLQLGGNHRFGHIPNLPGFQTRTQ